MKKISQLKGGAALSFTSIFLTNIIGLVITPFIIKSLGSSEYGLYTMIGALIGYLSVLDFGLNNTVIRYVAKYRAESDYQGEQNFLAHSFIMYGVISLLIIVVGIVFYLQLDDIYGGNLDSNQIDKAKTMLSILIFNLAITLPGGAFTGICYGYEQFILPKIVTIFRYIIRSVLVVVVLSFHGDSVSLVIIDTILNLLIIGVNAYIAFKILKAKVRLHSYNSKLFYQILGFSIWLFVFALVHQLRWQFGQLILGLFYPTATIAIYAVGITIGNYYGAFSNAIASVFLPRAIQMTVKNSTEDQLTDMFIKVSRIILIILMIVLGGFITIGEDFIYFWVGNEYQDAYYYIVAIMIGLTPILTQGFANNILEAKSLMSFRGKIILILTIAGVIVSYFMAKYFGIMEMILATIFFMILERVIMTPYYHKRANLNMFRYYREIVPLIIHALIIITIFVLVKAFFPAEMIFYTLLKMILYVLVYTSSIIFILSKYEKELFKKTLANFIQRFNS